MEEYPSASVDLATWLGEDHAPGVYAVESRLSPTVVAHANVAVRRHADSMVVFLPGARGAKSERRVPFYHRWAWQVDFPDTHVVALADPAASSNEALTGGWFLHPTLDLVAELSTIVSMTADHLGVARENIVFHGSSLGGFGALGMAAHLRGSHALAEIPQIDIEKWPFPYSRQLLSEHVGQPLAKFREQHPEQIDLIDRFRFAHAVPPFIIVTNVADASYELHLDFMDELQELVDECEVIGQQRLIVTESVSGHVPIAKSEAVQLIHELMPNSLA